MLRGQAPNPDAFQSAGMPTDGVLEQAIQDKLNQSMQAGIEDGYRARMEDEEANKSKEVTEEQIDRLQDKHNFDDDDDLAALRARRRQQMKEAQEKKVKYQQ